MSKKMELVKVDASEFGIEENKAKQISQQFKPMLDKMEFLEKEYNKIVRMKHSEEKEKKAHDLRMELVKVRTGTKKIHKQQKAFYLAGGRFVDAWKNAQEFASLGLEEKLQEIETRTEREQAEKIARLQEERKELIRDYVDEITLESLNLGGMDQDVFNAYFSQKKKDFEEIEAAKKRVQEIEQLRIEREEKLRPYFDFVLERPVDLSEMTEDDFNSLLLDAEENKREFQERKARHEERKIELRKFGEMVNYELDFLNMESKEYLEYFATLENKYQAEQEKKAEAERIKKIVSERSKRLNPFLRFVSDFEKVVNLGEKEFEKEFTRIKKEAEKTLKAEEKERAKAERIAKENAMIKARAAKEKADREAKEKAEAERLAKIEEEKEALKKQGDKAVLKDWIESFSLPFGEEPSGAKAKETYDDIAVKFGAFKKWALNEIEKL